MSPVYVTLYNTDTGQFTTRLATSGHIGSGELGAVHLRSQSLTSSAYASGSIGTEHLAAGAVTSAIIASGTVIALILSGSVGSGDIGNGAVVSGSVAASVLGGPHFANASFISANYGTTVAGVHIVNGSLLSANYGNTIAGVHILSGTIVSGLLANQSILSAQIGANVVATPHITNQGILSASIGANVIAVPHIANAGLISANYGTTIGGVHILSGTITSGLLANQSILSAQIGANIVATPHIANQGILSASVGTNIVGGPHIANASLLSSNYGTTIAGVHIVAASLLSGNYGNTIGGVHILSGTITSGLLANQSVLSAQIGANIIANVHVANQGLTSATLASGIVGAYHLGAASYGTSGQVLTAQLSGIQQVWADAAAGLTAPILSTSYGSGSIGGPHIAPASIRSSNYASGSIGSSHIGIVLGNIRSGSIQAPFIISGGDGATGFAPITFILNSGGSEVQSIYWSGLGVLGAQLAGQTRSLMRWTANVGTNEEVIASGVNYTLFLNSQIATQTGLELQTGTDFAGSSRGTTVIARIGSGTALFEGILSARSLVLTSNILTASIIASSNYQSGSIGGSHLAAASVVSANYASGSIGAFHLSPDTGMQVLDVYNSVSGDSTLAVSTSIARRHYRIEVYITSGLGNLRGGLDLNALGGGGNSIFHSKTTLIGSGGGAESIVTTLSGTYLDFVGNTAAAQSGGSCYWTVDIIALSGMPKLINSEGVIMARAADAGIVWGISRSVGEAVAISGGVLNFGWRDRQNGNIVGPGSTMKLLGHGNL